MKTHVYDGNLKTFVSFLGMIFILLVEITLMLTKYSLPLGVTFFFQ